jgi:hypothetical protein
MRSWKERSHTAFTRLRIRWKRFFLVSQEAQRVGYSKFTDLV